MSRDQLHASSRGVLHIYDCPDCLGQREVEVQTCGHVGTACPCSGRVVTCGTCNGEGRIEDWDCGCAEFCQPALNAYLEENAKEEVQHVH